MERFSPAHQLLTALTNLVYCLTIQDLRDVIITCWSESLKYRSQHFRFSACCRFTCIFRLYQKIKCRTLIQSANAIELNNCYSSYLRKIMRCDTAMVFLRKNARSSDCFRRKENVNHWVEVQ